MVQSSKDKLSKGILIGIVVGALLGGFFSEFGSDMYNSAKDWLISNFGESELTGSKLKEETITLYRDIMEFLKQRKDNEPQIDLDNWEELTNNLIKYSSETMNLYHENFGSRVVIIRQEYLKGGIKSDRLDQYYTHPTNPLGIREVAYGLAELAGKLNTTQ